MSALMMPRRCNSRIAVAWLISPFSQAAKIVAASAAFNPTRVKRTAVRYINRIVVPTHVDLDKYLNLTPRRLPHVGQDIEGYFMQLLLPQRDIDPECKCVINTGIEESPVQDCMNVLFDVDVFVPHTNGIAIDAIWPLLERLRDRKNDIFEAAITDEVRRIIR